MAETSTSNTPPGAQGGICVFSGGTAANFLVDVFDQLRRERDCPLSYIIPISDNGGSSSELIRVFGGPSVGDIRSRLVRLIPNPEGDEERTAIKTLFEYRLCKDPLKARSEWLDIVEARHLLWTFISSPKRELIRSILNILNMEIVKRARPTSVFNFAEASIGNMFLTGARVFSGSFESAIYLLSMICTIPDSISVLPSINSNFTHHISAGLADGTTIAGQTAISHPSAPTSLPDTLLPTSPSGATADPHIDPHQAKLLVEAHDRIEDANLPGSLPVLRRPQITFSKDDEEDLPARVSRIWYINPYGHEIWPLANPKVLAQLSAARAVVYSIGSLYTSIIPNLVLRGVGEALSGGDSDTGPKHKILVLNSKIDRETGPREQPMAAVDFVKAVVRAGKESQVDFGEVQDGECRRYVTHLVHLDGPGTPFVDRTELGRLGIRCVRVKGRVDRKPGAVTGGVLRYEEGELARVLGEIIDS